MEGESLFIMVTHPAYVFTVHQHCTTCLMSKLLKGNIPPNIVNVLHDSKDDKIISKRTMDYLRRLAVCQHLGANADNSPAQALLKRLQNLDGCRFLALTGSMDSPLKKGSVNRRFYSSKSSKKEGTSIGPT